MPGALCLAVQTLCWLQKLGVFDGVFKCSLTVMLDTHVAL